MLYLLFFHVSICQLIFELLHLIYLNDLQFFLYINNVYFGRIQTPLFCHIVDFEPLNRPVHFIIPIIHIPRCIPYMYISERTYIESKSRDLSSNSIYPPPSLENDCYESDDKTLFKPYNLLWYYFPV